MYKVKQNKIGMLVMKGGKKYTLYNSLSQEYLKYLMNELGNDYIYYVKPKKSND